MREHCRHNGITPLSGNSELNCGAHRPRSGGKHRFVNVTIQPVVHPHHPHGRCSPPLWALTFCLILSSLIHYWKYWTLQIQYLPHRLWYLNGKPTEREIVTSTILLRYFRKIFIGIAHITFICLRLTEYAFERLSLFRWGVEKICEAEQSAEVFLFECIVSNH